MNKCEICGKEILRYKSRCYRCGATEVFVEQMNLKPLTYFFELIYKRMEELGRRNKSLQNFACTELKNGLAQLTDANRRDTS